MKINDIIGRSPGNFKSTVKGNVYETEITKFVTNGKHHVWGKTIPATVHRNNLDILIRFADSLGYRYEVFIPARDLLIIERFTVPCDANGTVLGTGSMFRYVKRLGLAEKSA